MSYSCHERYEEMHVHSQMRTISSQAVAPRVICSSLSQIIRSLFKILASRRVHQIFPAKAALAPSLALINSWHFQFFEGMGQMALCIVPVLLKIFHVLLRWTFQHSRIPHKSLRSKSAYIQVNAPSRYHTPNTFFATPWIVFLIAMGCRIAVDCT